MRTAALAIAALAFVSITGCGGGKSCSDACNTVANCTTKLGITPPLGFENAQNCTAQCNADTTCPNKQAYLDCAAGLTCTANIVAGVQACITNAGC